MKIYLDILDEPPLTFLKLKNIEAVDYMSFLFFRERNKNDVLKVIKTEKTKIRKGMKREKKSHSKKKILHGRSHRQNQPNRATQYWATRPSDLRVWQASSQLHGIQSRWTVKVEA